MSEPTITCPHCKSEIKLTESLAAPLLARREKELREQATQTLKAEREKIAIEETNKAKAALSTELQQKESQVAELSSVLKQRDEKLAEAQKAQAELMKKQREFEDAKREMELTIEKRVQESLGTAREQAKRSAEETLLLKIQERDQVISSLQKHTEELKRKLEQGSQQLQGEVLELNLEALLRQKFPHDSIEPVAKGEFGGDVLQRVHTTGAQLCGTILWESKRTKNWSDGWLGKLRDDQRTAKADIAILVTQTLPKEVRSFDCIDKVWVTEPGCAIAVALAMRQSLLELHAVRQSSEGQQTKMELVYQYLTGPRFRHRVQAIAEKFGEMQLDLEKERKMMLKQWAKREEQIRGVIESTAGMYGDLQGIAGRSLQEIDGLEVEQVEDSRYLGTEKPTNTD
ncbi:MAG: DUF2130 domain-containing protein [Deltaproteobacteria bacterium]|nr:DUF2130 domain-containing protein [Deltaproteobacteria bacterium]